MNLQESAEIDAIITSLTAFRRKHAPVVVPSPTAPGPLSNLWNAASYPLPDMPWPASTPNVASYSWPAPAGFTAAVFWGMALDDNRVGLGSLVEMQSMNLYAHTSGGDQLLHSNDYETSAAAFQGCLLLRKPWCGQEPDSTPPELPVIPPTAASPSVAIAPSKWPQNVGNWWQDSRVLIPAGASYLWANATFRITGPAMVALGIDYWRNLTVGYGGYNVNNTEAGATKFFTAADCAGQFITATLGEGGKP